MIQTYHKEYVDRLEGVLTELQDAIAAPDDIDSVEVTVEQGLLRRACMQIRRLRAERIRQQAPP